MPSDLSDCHYEEINDDTILTEPIDGVPYQTCDELGTFFGINGESIIYFPCGGYTLDIYPNQTNSEQFS